MPDYPGTNDEVWEDAQNEAAPMVAERDAARDRTEAIQAAGDALYGQPSGNPPVPSHDPAGSDNGDNGWYVVQTASDNAGDLSISFDALYEYDSDDDYDLSVASLGHAGSIVTFAGLHDEWRHVVTLTQPATMDSSSVIHLVGTHEHFGRPAVIGDNCVVWNHRAPDPIPGDRIGSGGWKVIAFDAPATTHGDVTLHFERVNDHDISGNDSIAAIAGANAFKTGAIWTFVEGIGWRTTLTLTADVTAVNEVYDLSGKRTEASTGSRVGDVISLYVQVAP